MEKNYYKDNPFWKKFYSFFPEHNRLNDMCEPEEKYWEWESNQIHLEHDKNPQAKAKIIMLHGVGGNGRILSFMAVPLFKRGYEVLAPDLPGYGLSLVKDLVNYDSWIRMVDSFIDEETRKDNRPIILFGLSAGWH